MTDDEPTPDRLAQRVNMTGLVLYPLVVLAGCAARPPSQATSGPVASLAAGAARPRSG